MRGHSNGYVWSCQQGSAEGIKVHVPDKSRRVDREAITVCNSVIIPSRICVVGGVSGWDCGVSARCFEGVVVKLAGYKFGPAVIKG